MEHKKVDFTFFTDLKICIAQTRSSWARSKPAYKNSKQKKANVTSYQKYLSVTKPQQKEVFKAYREITEEDENAESWEVVPDSNAPHHREHWYNVYNTVDF